MKRTKEQIKKRKLNRAYRLDVLEWMDNIIKHLKMNDEKLEKLKELRGNSIRYTAEELKEKTLYIINN